jgi:hypothetical protein
MSFKMSERISEQEFSDIKKFVKLHFSKGDRIYRCDVNSSIYLEASPYVFDFDKLHLDGSGTCICCDIYYFYSKRKNLFSWNITKHGTLDKGFLSSQEFILKRLKYEPNIELSNSYTII